MRRVLLSIIGIVVACLVVTIGAVDNVARSQHSLPAPTGVTATNGASFGEADLSWPAVSGATYYRIGWMADEDYQRAIRETHGEWEKEFRYSNIINRGQPSHTVTRLTPGIKYWFIVGSHNAFYGAPQWSSWEELTLTAASSTEPAPMIDYVTLYPNCAAVRAHYPGGATRSSPIYRPELDRDGDGIACGATDTAPQQHPGSPAPTDTIQSSSTTASAAPEIRLTIASLDRDLPVGGSIVLYLEDDFQEPDSIPMSSVYLAAAGGSAMHMRTTGNGTRVYATSPVMIKTDAYFDEGKEDIAILMPVPDMCTSATAECEGPNGLHQGQRVSLVVTSDSGIKNPSEAGTHSVFFDVLGPTELIPSAANVRDRNDGMRAAGTERTLKTAAKISLSDPDNKRGYVMTVTGSGFNNGTAAGVYVYHTTGEMPSCETIINMGTNVGYAIVSSDDRVQVTFEVTVPTFGPGNTNYICMVDGEGRMSDTDVEVFHLEPAIRVIPDSVSTGDTVNVFVQDFPNPGAGFVELKIAGRVISGVVGSSIRTDGSGEATFSVPGGLEGVLRIDAKWGDVFVSSKITIAGAS